MFVDFFKSQFAKNKGQLVKKGIEGDSQITQSPKGESQLNQPNMQRYRLSQPKLWNKYVQYNTMHKGVPQYLAITLNQLEHTKLKKYKLHQQW